jgi:hypothetical protein
MTQFTATQCYSVQDKEKFVKHFVRFVESGYKETVFPKWFYVNLSHMFGHIAEHNKAGFYGKFFTSSAGVTLFWEHIKRHHYCGDPAYTFVDCEIAIREHYRGHSLLHVLTPFYLKRNFGRMI